MRRDFLPTRDLTKNILIPTISSETIGPSDLLSLSPSLDSPFSNQMSPSNEILIHSIFSMEGVHPFEEIDGKGKRYWLPFIVYPHRLNPSFRAVYNPFLIVVEVFMSYLKYELVSNSSWSFTSSRSLRIFRQFSFSQGYQLILSFSHSNYLIRVIFIPMRRLLWISASSVQ